MKKLSKLFLILLGFILSMQIMVFASPDDDYPEVYDAYWNNYTARWSVEGRANKYEVVLYRDGRRVTSRITHSRSYNFSSEMSRGDHDYYFEVRPYNNDTDWGNWIQSDSKYVEYYRSGTIIPSVPATDIPSGGPGETTANAPSMQVVYNPVGQWQAINNTWHFVYTNGVMASNTWLQINNKWYFIDINTNMVVGLQNIGDATYYFNPDGSMVTGGLNINGMNHYFDGNGKMVY